jgi:predicted O-linked N-acetylglucosamine transferase (SPINDLY family)
MREAIKICERFKHRDDNAWSNLLLWYCSVSDEPDKILKRSQDYGRRFESTEKYEHAGYDNFKPRIGIVSPDLYSHAVSNFIRPIFENAVNHDVELYVYRTGGGTDNVTEEFKTLAHAWFECENMSNGALAELIRFHKIDTLIDLSGHTNGGLRLPMFTSKPAPCQITYLGYSGTTGMSCFDYRIVDKFTDAEKNTSEELLYTDDCFLCYSPRACDVPEIQEVRSDKFRFSSFARVEKITPEMVGIWNTILTRCPDSELVLKAKAFDDEDVKSRYIKMFAGNESRIKILPQAEYVKKHLARYNEVDLTLDTFPYSGTTTTCESLIMGVPVVTMFGRSHQSRVTASILKNSGYQDWCCSNPDSYISMACSFYGLHKNGYPEDRQMISNGFKKTTVCDSKEFAHGFFDMVKNCQAVLC